MEFLSIILFLFAMLAIAGVAIGLIGLLFKKFRPKAKRITGVSLAIFVVSVSAGPIIQGKVDDRKAQEKGFASATDESTAMKAGFKNAPDWIAHKKAQAEQAAAQAAQAQAEAAERRAKEEAAIAERQAREEAQAAARQAKAQERAAALLAEAQSAGFSSADDYQSAKALGLNKTEWQKRKAQEEAELQKRNAQAAAKREAAARVEGLKNIDKSIELVEEADMDDVSGLFIKIRTAAWDGGSSDFRSFARVVSRIAEELRKEPRPYVKMRVGLVIPVLDKYGNPEDANGGDIDWNLSELAKVNLDAGHDYVLRAADKVQFKRMGGEMARTYCKDNDLRDPRYCRRP